MVVGLLVELSYRLPAYLWGESNASGSPHLNLLDENIINLPNIGDVIDLLLRRDGDSSDDIGANNDPLRLNKNGEDDFIPLLL